LIVRTHVSHWPARAFIIADTKFEADRTAFEIKEARTREGLYMYLPFARIPNGVWDDAFEPLDTLNHEPAKFKMWLQGFRRKKKEAAEDERRVQASPKVASVSSAQNWKVITIIE
jgi:hypothetical protein